MSDQVSIDDKLQTFFAGFPLHHYPKGQILIHADEAPQHVIYLEEGLIRQYDISYRGDEVVVNVYKPGAFLPMSWAINNQTNTYFFDAETAVSVRLVHPKEMVAFITDNPEVMYDLLSRVYKGLDGLLGRMVQLMSGSAAERLFQEILIECKRFGVADSSGNIRLTITERSLGSRAGLTRETVSREISKLSHDGLVTMNPKGLVVHSMAELESRLKKTS